MTKRNVPIDRDDEPNEVTTPPTPPEAPAAPAALEMSIDPSSGPEHTAITITGTDFGETAGTLALNEVPAPVVIWTPLAIQTIVPYGATSGDLTVITADGRRGSAPFTVTEKPA